MIKGYEELGHFESLGMPYSHTKYMQTIARTAISVDIVLSAKAWDWIDDIKDNDVLNRILFVLMVLCLKGLKSRCDLATVLLENKELFFRYIVN